MTAPPTLVPPGRWASAPILLFLALWGLLAWVGWRTPLTADEAYYLDWSRHLAPGYFDHPPGVAWLIAAAGGHVRLAGWLGVAVLGAVLADAARRLGSPAWRWAPAALLGTPAGFTLGLVVTPDLPVLLAGGGLVWAWAARLPVVAAIALAAALWSKSTALVAVPGVVLAFGWRSPLILGIAGALYAPHLVWSLGHHGDPFAYQAGRSSWRFGLPEFVGAQLLVVTPGLLWAALRRWRRPATDRERALGWLVWPHLLAFALLACVTRVEANWPALALPGALVLLLVSAGESQSVSAFDAKLLRRGFAFSVALTAVAGGLLPWLSAAFPQKGPPRDPAQLAACVRSPTQAAGPTESVDRPWSAPSAAVPMVAARYQEMALLAATAQPTFYRRAIGHRASQYDRWTAPEPPACDFLYLADARALGECPGPITPLKVCGRAATWCACALRGRQG